VRAAQHKKDAFLCKDAIVIDVPASLQPRDLDRPDTKEVFGQRKFIRPSKLPAEIAIEFFRGQRKKPMMAVAASVNRPRREF